MSILSFFSTTCETRELHRDPDLRTKYYRNSFNQCLEALKKYAEAENLDLKNVNPVHGELYMLGNGFDMIITVTQITPQESGIDIKVNVFGLMGMNKPKKRALELYAFLDSSLRFKGVSLHP
ncbi:MAG: hypothetical protein WC251_04175 [Candidatus Izemoplasmatales bacterium]|jgi:hypothetical protein|nr:hypothetical protein [Candidatus Izemoplasmatales bacterium]MDD5294193.1 hypothetical protein [Candidatus Izemoplasmatales bacterium]